MTIATILMLAEMAAPQAPLPDIGKLRRCEDSLDVSIFNMPRRPDQRRDLSVVVVADKDPGPVRMVARSPDGAQRVVDPKISGGPPFGFTYTMERPERGNWRFALVSQAGEVLACQRVKVRWRRKVDPMQVLDVENPPPVWKSRVKWERDVENLYSLWIEHLFDAPLEADVSWRPLSEVLRDPDRNLLYNYLALDEDASRGDHRLRANPDCADFPYYLRGYFAWKLGLPFTFRACRRGNAKRPPRCSEEFYSNEMPAEAEHKVDAFEKFARKMQSIVHSSSLRSLPEDQKSDFYPVELTRHSLRPGTIYADPYGHTMMVGRWYPQEGTNAGVLMAVDAQPDGTIGRRIFWRGSFMFPEDDKLAGAGWKRFRPVRKKRDVIEVLSNRDIDRKTYDYGDFSLEQWENGKEGFYETMDELITPRPLPPTVALTATIDALDQQVRRRVESVENGEQWKRERPGVDMEMPNGGKIFITSGPWEDYSTPSRDMRLLIAMDTVLNFPERVEKYPHRFVLPKGVSQAQLRRNLTRKIKTLTQARKYTYRRSDGSTWPLTLADVLSRIKRFEVSYNPNECVERRWAAEPGSKEIATCNRRAPEDQQMKVRLYRPWFEKRERPAHTRGRCRDPAGVCAP